MKEKIKKQEKVKEEKNKKGGNNQIKFRNNL